MAGIAAAGKEPSPAPAAEKISPASVPAAGQSAPAGGSEPEIKTSPEAAAGQSAPAGSSEPEIRTFQDPAGPGLNSAPAPGRSQCSSPPPAAFLSEEEFLKQNLYPQWPVQAIRPLTPAVYPDQKPGTLVITRHRGSFLRPCPATPRWSCCGLNIFHFGQGCHLGCRYCILEAYLGSPAVFRFGNSLTEGLAELKEILAAIEAGRAHPWLTADRSYRFCTGEFTDSLIYDQGFNVSEALIRLLAGCRRSYLELKTKTADIDHLLHLDHRGQTVLAFSVNAPEISRLTEPRAAPLAERLKAARRAAGKGYPIGLHFDPIIYYDGFRAGYREAVRLIDQYVPWDRLAWISLGCFRYLPPLKPILLAQNPSDLFDREFVRAPDGKMRYPRPLREMLYENLLEALRPHLDPRTTVYFCMESSRLWRDQMGFDPGTTGLTARFREPILSRSWQMTPETQGNLGNQGT